MATRPFPLKRYPANAITPHGAYYVLSGKKPHMVYRSYDDTAVFHLMGGMAIPDKVNQPESIRIKSLGGLIAPWQPIEQKGATQDGVTFIDALYDPLDCDMVVEAVGKTPERTARLIADWIAAWDARLPGELSFFDQYAGRWWAPVRWTRNPVDKLRGAKFTRQEFTWPFKSHDAFWRSYDNVDEFHFGYSTLNDDFNDANLSVHWTVAYSGPGDGTMVIADRFDGLLETIFGTGGKEVKWNVGAANDSRTAVARRTGFATSTDRQVAYMTFGSTPQWSFWDEAYNDIWLRLNTTGTPGTSGIRLRVQQFNIEVSYFVGGVEHSLRNRPLLIRPLPGETFAFMAGVGEGSGSDRTYKVMRGINGLAEVMTVREPGSTSLMGAGNRGMGFGMESGQGASFEKVPGAIRRFTGGDNSTQTQSGLLRRINMGDQPMWDRYTLTGPGTFYIAAGPGSTDMVKYGPLERNQMVQLRTDPRKRGVVDLTSVPPTPQQLNFWQQALKDFVSFASGNNASPLEEEILSKFGIKPPQGNMYSLLKGRFTKPIPPKPVAGRAQAYTVRVEVVNGDADTRIVAAGTPLRRWPLG